MAMLKSARVSPRELVAIEMLAAGLVPTGRDVQLVRSAVAKLRAVDGRVRAPRVLTFRAKPGRPSEWPRALAYIRAHPDVHTIRDAARRLGLHEASVSRMARRAGKVAALARLFAWRRRRLGLSIRGRAYGGDAQAVA